MKRKRLIDRLPIAIILYLIVLASVAPYLISETTADFDTQDPLSQMVSIGPGVETLWSDLPEEQVSVPEGEHEPPMGYEIDAALLEELKSQPFVRSDDWHAIEEDLAISALEPQPLAPNKLRNFEGPDNYNQPDGYWHRPPDPHIAAGLNHVGVMVNSEFCFYTKDGTLVWEEDFVDWWSNVYPGVSFDIPFDPRIAYDHHENRWLMVCLIKNSGLKESYYLVSVSQGSNPLGGWWNWKINGKLNYGGSDTWADYPDLGFDGISSASGGAIYITSNQFTFATHPSFKTAMLNIFPKTIFYTGAGGGYWYKWGRTNNDGSQAFTLRTAWTYGNPGKEYLINSKSGGWNKVTLWNVVPNAVGGPTWTRQATISIGSYSPPPGAKQKGTSHLIDTIDNRIYNCVYRNGYLYAAFTEKYDWGTPVNQECILRYLKISTATNAAIIDKGYGLDNYYYYFPTITADASNNIVIVFARSSATEYAGIRYSGRLTTDTSMQSSAQLKAGETYVLHEADETVARWGDYFGIDADPVCTNNVWIYGEWAKDCPGTSAIWDWGTWVGEVTFSDEPCRVYFYTDPSTVGSISFEGQTYTHGDYDNFDCGTIGQATAYAPACYRFDHWVTYYNVKVSSTTANPTTVTVNCGGILQAVFERISCKVVFYTSPSDVGSITFEDQTYTNGKSDVFDCGTSGYATANVPTCWEFDHWEATGNVIVRYIYENPTPVIINCGGTLKAIFKRIQCKVVFYTSPSDIGSITFQDQKYTNGESDIFDCGTSGYATANAPACWVLDHWETEGNVYVKDPKANPTGVTVRCGGALIAVFKKIEECNVTFLIYPTTGSITFEGKTYTNGQSESFGCGTSGPATANTPTCWLFDHWETTGNVKVSSTTANPTNVTVNCGGTLKAVFKRIECKVTFYTNPSTIGTITFKKKNYTNGETDIFYCGTEDLAAANALTCWEFDHWETKDNVYVKDPKANPTGVTVRCGGALIAVFKQIECKVTFYTRPSDIGFIAFRGKTYANGDTDIFPCGTEDLATAKAPECWEFDHWETKENVYVEDPKANPTLVAIRCGGVLVAVFRQIECEVTFYTDPSDIGSIIIGLNGMTYTNNETGTFLCGTKESAYADAPSCWTFAYWETTDNVYVSNRTANPTNVTITCGGTLKAVFYALPDLVVTDVQLPYPIPILYEGIEYNIGVTVENVGPVSAGSFNVSLQLYWVHGGLVDYYGEVNVPELASGEDVTVNFQASTSHITATILTATADCNNNVTECNEKNNRLEIEMRSRIAGDVDGNDKVDHVDLLLLAAAYGSKVGDDNYNPLADINADGKIDHVDLLILAGNYGKALPE